MKLVNCTPTTITIHGAGHNGMRLAMLLPPSGHIARVKVVTCYDGPRDVTCPKDTKFLLQGVDNVTQEEQEDIDRELESGPPRIAIFYRTCGRVEGLPGPKPGVIYIVSPMVAMTLPDRDDLLVPGPLVQDTDGQAWGKYTGLMVPQLNKTRQ